MTQQQHGGGARAATRPHRPVGRQRRPAGRQRGPVGRFSATVMVALATLWAFARGNVPVDDRGSDSSEKAFMIILAIAAGTAVTAAAVAFIATKTALFK